MGLNLFGKKKQEPVDSGEPAASEAAPKRDLNRAKRFFEHAEATADARNYDYAIECYINGLRHDPDNMMRHEALYEVAKRRKVAGGKPASFKEKFKGGGRGPVEKLLHAEMLWAKDPLSLKRMIEVMERAMTADEAEEDLNLAELGAWIGNMLLEAGHTSKPPAKEELIKIRNIFHSIGAYDQAVEACRMAVELDPEDEGLIQEYRDLQAEATMHSGYTESVQEEGSSFRKVVKNLDKQTELEQESALTKTEGAIKSIVERRRIEFEEKPDDIDRVEKLVNALVESEDPENESEAIKLLEAAYEKTTQYRLRVRAGDIQIKRMARQLRKTKDALDKDPKNPELREKWKEIAKRKVTFELEQYQERVENYPTELGLKYELGKRLMAFKQYDQAISMFQVAKQDPKHRSGSNQYLAECYMAKEWIDEAIETLRDGITNHPVKTDGRAKELRYLLMDALERKAQMDQSPEIARDAQKVCSELLQTDIGYRDIQERMEKIRGLVHELSQKA